MTDANILETNAGFSATFVGKGRNSRRIQVLAAGFERVDAERGALLYAFPARLNCEFAFGLQLCAEALLDLLPVSWVRSFSDQVIGLFRKVK